MFRPLEDYGLIGDTQSAALVGRDGSIDWLCLPRFDSDACFAALLGSEENGCWRICPTGQVVRTARRYRGETLVLETEFHTRDGAVRLTDVMPPRQRNPDLVRVVEGLRGTVEVCSALALRFGYGEVRPLLSQEQDHLLAVGGPNAIAFWSEASFAIRDGVVKSVFRLGPGERRTFLLGWHPSHEPTPPPIDAAHAVHDTEAWWRAWAQRCTFDGPWRREVVRSLLVLKALTYLPTGGLVAAPTTSLPERLGGVRNWDYRYCWVRDATFTLHVLLSTGFAEEARQWRDWLLRATAGSGSHLRIMYGLAGERRLPEIDLPWLAGYEGSRPVRIGNAAAEQLQLDVYGEVMDCMHLARRRGIAPSDEAWALQQSLMEHLESKWECPDEGIWEVRGPRRHFTHSKVMAWVAFDRAIKAVERFGLPGPVDRWRKLQAAVFDEVCRCGYHAGRRAFTQQYGSSDLDASLLMIPLVGFLPPTDPRVQSTVEAIERELTQGPLVYRYKTPAAIDGLPEGEGAFLACAFWFCDCLALMGRRSAAAARFEQLLSLSNDLGLLSEQYDADRRRLVGNFPQALSHVALVNTAWALGARNPPVELCIQADRAGP